MPHPGGQGSAARAKRNGTEGEMYNYSEQKPFVFTEKGQVCFLAIRDHKLNRTGEQV